MHTGPELRAELSQQLGGGGYRPGLIRRVWIPKASGGQRGLGIPNVVDRVVQEAVRLEIDPLYEPTFHTSSHGFRKGRSCHTALAQARQYVEEGHEFVVDLDLEKFFDRVPHQRLMATLSLRIHDRDVLALIGRMLRAGVVPPEGVHRDGERVPPRLDGICTEWVRVLLRTTDAHIRRRRRALVLKDWKRKRTIARKLIALGVKRKTAWRSIYAGRKSPWSMSIAGAVERGLRNAYFAERGLVSLEQLWEADPRRTVAPVQLTLSLG